VPDRTCTATLRHVQSGDTFFSIADQYVVSFDDLLKANEQTKLDLLALRRGQVLNTPLQRKPRSSFTVRQGDDLWRIAQLTGMRMSFVQADNPDAVPPTPGSCLRIRTYPSYQIEFENGRVHSSPDLPQDLSPASLQQDDHFREALTTQLELLKPQGKAMFKFPSIEAPQLECFFQVR